MRLFLDTSVVLAACASSAGASREVIRLASANDWILITTPYIEDEVQSNLPDFPPAASAEWLRMQNGLLVMKDVWSMNRPAVFPVRKDRPVLFSAAAWADVLLTLDRGDFNKLLGGWFYSLAILKPGDFLQRERASGSLRDVP